MPHCPLPGTSGQPGLLDPIHGFAHEAWRWAESQRKNLDLPTPMFSVLPLWPLRLVLSSQPQPYDQPQGVSSCPLPWWLLRGPVSPGATSRDRTLLPLCCLPGEDSVPSLCAHNGSAHNGSFLKLFTWVAYPSGRGDLGFGSPVGKGEQLCVWPKSHFFAAPWGSPTPVSRTQE